MYCLFLFSLFICFAVICTSAPSEHLIRDLPGLHNSSSIKFRQYAGYVTIEKTRNKKLFYWFVESQRDPAADPLVFWTSGGPGYSSLGTLLTEHGPFRVLENGDIEPSPYSWNRVANVLYVETPCGVGFSRSDDPNDYYSDDQKSAADNYIFIKNWFELFPEYKKHDFILSSLSYGGHYIPNLVREILEKDVEGDIRVKGLLVGNPATYQDWFLRQMPGDNSWSYMLYLYSHGLMSHAAYIDAFVKCDFASDMVNCDTSFSDKSNECRMAIAAGLKELSANIDIYDVEVDVCLDNNTDWTKLKQSSRSNDLVRFMRESLMSKIGYEQQFEFDPCRELYDPRYLNRPEVQTAIHADPTNWKEYGTTTYGTMKDNMIPLWRDILNNPRTEQWRILIFSGDFDVVVPFLSTQQWIHCLGRPVKTPYHSWMINGQVAGNVIEYDRLSFLTIKGSGHDISYYTPEKGFVFFQRWIDNIPL